MRTIYLTVDTECHDIKRINQYIYGNVAREAYGIEKILELAKEYEIPVNFFVDVGECRKYGREVIQQIVDIIHSYDQPVFFHLHPDYISGDNRTFLWEYSTEEQRKIIAEGLSDYQSFVKTGDRLVFRAGRYGVNGDSYRILESYDFEILDLSYLCNSKKMCKAKKDEIPTNNAAVVRKKVTVLPNTRFIAFDYFGKKVCLGLDSADATFDEFSRVIQKTRLKHLVFTMHSWNFIKKWFFLPNIIRGDKAMERKFRRSVQVARKNGFQFGDLRDYVFEQEPDELLNLCTGFVGKVKGLCNNFVRFQKIARLNKKYFAIYTAFYSVLVLLILVCVMVGCL